MPNFPEWSQDWSRKITDLSGGSSFAEASAGGEVAFTRFGEMACRLEETGDMTATFADEGLICGYLEDGELAFVLVDLMSYFQNFGEEDFKFMAKKGIVISELLTKLNETNQDLFLTVFPGLGAIKTELWCGTDSINSNMVQDNLKGTLQVIKFDDLTIAFKITKSGDELTISLGEIDKINATLIPVSISKHVDYMDDLESSRTDRYFRLADKIILTR